MGRDWGDIPINQGAPSPEAAAFIMDSLLESVVGIKPAGPLVQPLAFRTLGGYIALSLAIKFVEIGSGCPEKFAFQSNIFSLKIFSLLMA